MAKVPAQDAITLLKTDHRKVEQLFEQYEKSRSKKSDIVQQICTELSIHATIEEEILYPACMAAVGKDTMNEAYVEHDGAKMMIAELAAASLDDDEFYDAKVKVLSEEIKHHVKEEEGEIFPQLRQSGADLKALGERMRARKEELTAEIKQRGLPTPITRTMKGGKVVHGEIVA